jgi:hypothetical protein
MDAANAGKFVAYYRVSTQREGRSGLGAQQDAVRNHLLASCFSHHQAALSIAHGLADCAHATLLSLRKSVRDAPAAGAADERRCRPRVGRN